MKSKKGVELAGNELEELRDRLNNENAALNKLLRNIQLYGKPAASEAQEQYKEKRKQNSLKTK